MDFLSRFLRKSPAKEMFTSITPNDENTSGDQSSTKKHSDIPPAVSIKTDQTLSVASDAKNNKISDESSDSSLDYGSANEDNSPHDDSSSFPLSDINLNKHQPESEILKKGTNLSQPTTIEKQPRQKIYNEITESFETPDSSILNITNSHLSGIETCEIGEDPLSLNEKDFLTALTSADVKENFFNININRGCDNTENDSFILALSEETFTENTTFNNTIKDVKNNECEDRQEREASVEVILEDENVSNQGKIENKSTFDDLSSNQTCDIERSEDTESVENQECDSYTRSRRDSDSSIFVIDSEGTNNTENALEDKEIDKVLNDILFRSMNTSKTLVDVNIIPTVNNEVIEKSTEIVATNESLNNVNNNSSEVSEMEKQDILNGNHMMLENNASISNEATVNKSDYLIDRNSNNSLTNSQIDNSILALTLELKNYEENVETSIVNDLSKINGNDLVEVKDNINYEITDVSMSENFPQCDAGYSEPMDCDESFAIPENLPIKMVESLQTDDPFKTRARVQNSSDRDMIIDNAPKSFDENMENPFITKNKMHNSNEYLNNVSPSKIIEETVLVNNESTKLDPIPISNQNNVQIEEKTDTIKENSEESHLSNGIHTEINTNNDEKYDTMESKLEVIETTPVELTPNDKINVQIEEKTDANKENLEESHLSNGIHTEINTNNDEKCDTMESKLEVVENTPVEFIPNDEINENTSSLIEELVDTPKTYNFDMENPFATKCKVYNSNENLNIISADLPTESNKIDLPNIDSVISNTENLSDFVNVNGDSSNETISKIKETDIAISMPNGNVSIVPIIEKVKVSERIDVDLKQEIIPDDVEIFAKPYAFNMDALNITGSIESIEVKTHDSHKKPIISDKVEICKEVKNDLSNIEKDPSSHNIELNNSLNNMSKNSLEDTHSLGETTKDISQFSDTILASSGAESDSMSTSQISTNSNKVYEAEPLQRELFQKNSLLKIVEATDVVLNNTPKSSLRMEDPFKTRTRIQNSSERDSMLVDNIQKSFDDMENPFITKNKMHNSNERLNESKTIDEANIINDDKITTPSEDSLKTVVKNTISKQLSRGSKTGLSPMSKSGDLMGMSPITHSNKNGEKSERSNLVEYDLLTGGQLNNDDEINNIIMEEEDEFKVPDELFKDPAAFDFLLSCGNSGPGGKSVPARDFGKESLFVKFDPLVGLPTGTRPGREAEIHSSPETSISYNKVNEDVSTASGLAESCSSDSSVSALTSDAGKPTGTMSSVEQSLSVLSLQPQNSSPPVATVAAVPQSIINVNLQTIDKPTQVVSPAKSTRQQYQPCTPPQLASSKPTLPVTPAIAAIDRLINLGLNTTPPPPPVVVQPKEPEMDPHLVKELQTVREILANQEQELQQANDRISTLQQQLVKSNEEKESLIERVNEKNRNHRQMSVVMEEYERTMSSLIGEREIEKRQWLEEKVTLARERDEASSHLASIEHSFNDIHAKYERCKTVIQSYKTNEDVLKQTLARNDETLKKQVERYEQLRQHAMSQLDKASQEIDAVRKSSQAEIIKMQAMLKKADIQITSLQQNLAQKTKNCDELTSICDELINKVG